VIHRQAWRLAKRTLAAVGLQLDRPHVEFATRLTSARHLDGMLTRIADTVEQWLAQQSILPVAALDAKPFVEGFFEAYLKTPFREAIGQSRFNKLLWLAIVARALRPALIVDSGTYRGASAWALAFGAPDAKILSFDPHLSQLPLRVPNCEYVQGDWMQRDLAGFDLAHSLCYFDDAVDQVRRVLEAKARGISFALFNDDLPLTCFAVLTPSPARLPKLEFLHDPLLVHGEAVEWTWNGAPRRWIVDQDYLEKGRAAIKASERLPDLGPITGVRVWSPTLVAL
jgi:hypothetical protein